MNNIISTNEFSAICKKRGFSKRRNVYSRCIGDGVLQILSLDETAYMNPASPEYTNTHRESKYISIGFWSMYSPLPEHYYSSGNHVGVYTPENIIGQRFSSETFFGLQSEYQIMMSWGFEFLDSITTQRKLLDATYLLDCIARGGPKSHQTNLCAPFLICGEWLNALNRLNGLYTHIWLSFHLEYNHLRDAGQLDLYLQKEKECEEGLKPTVEFLMLVLRRREDEILDYLESCFKKNLRLAQENKIPFSDDFKPCSFVKGLE